MSSDSDYSINYKVMLFSLIWILVFSTLLSLVSSVQSTYTTIKINSSNFNPADFIIENSCVDGKDLTINKGVSNVLPTTNILSSMKSAENKTDCNNLNFNVAHPDGYIYDETCNAIKNCSAITLSINDTENLNLAKGSWILIIWDLFQKSFNFGAITSPNNTSLLFPSQQYIGNGTNKLCNGTIDYANYGINVNDLNSKEFIKNVCYSNALKYDKTKCELFGCTWLSSQNINYYDLEAGSNNANSILATIGKLATFRYDFNITPTYINKMLNFILFWLPVIAFILAVAVIIRKLIGFT